MAVSRAGIVAILLVLGFTHVLAASSAAQDVDASHPGNISPSLCAGLFQHSLTLPAEEGWLNREGLARSIALQAAAAKPDRPARSITPSSVPLSSHRSSIAKPSVS